MSLRFVGGTSDDCLPKLRRWPFSFLHLVALSTALYASLS